jgi:hypothetical protein
VAPTVISVCVLQSRGSPWCSSECRATACSYFPWSVEKFGILAVQHVEVRAACFSTCLPRLRQAH